MDLRTLERIENSAALQDVFGAWPTFHDAEILRLLLDREPADGPVLSIDVYAFAVTSLVDEAGQFIRQSEVVAVLDFAEVELIHLEGFNRQNVLSSIDIRADERSQDRLVVLLNGIHGVSAEFGCGRVIVRSVRPAASP